MNTTESNKLIDLWMAEFEEYESDKLTIINDLEVKGFEPNHYDEQWDLLMPVVEKIGEVTEEPEVLDDYTYIMIYGGQIRISTEIEGVFHDVVDIIERYNENKS